MNKIKISTRRILKHHALVVMPYELIHFLINKKILHYFIECYVRFRAIQRRGIALSEDHFRCANIIDLAFEWADANNHLRSNYGIEVNWRRLNDEYICISYND